MWFRTAATIAERSMPSSSVVLDAELLDIVALNVNVSTIKTTKESVLWFVCRLWWNRRRKTMAWDWRRRSIEERSSWWQSNSTGTI